jgi:hypothetical protein
MHQPERRYTGFTQKGEEVMAMPVLSVCILIRALLLNDKYANAQGETGI